MSATVAQWGNSLAIRIPASHAKKLALSAGHLVDITVRAGRLLIEPLTQSAAPQNFDALYAQMTPENTHAAANTGAPVGKEVVAW
jgi:antitoxin MazE